MQTETISFSVEMKGPDATAGSIWSLNKTIGTREPKKFDTVKPTSNAREITIDSDHVGYVDVRDLTSINK